MAGSVRADADDNVKALERKTKKLYFQTKTEGRDGKKRDIGTEGREEGTRGTRGEATRRGGQAPGRETTVNVR